MWEPPTAADAISMPGPNALSLLSQVETPSCPAAEAESAPSTFAPAQAADADRLLFVFIFRFFPIPPRRASPVSPPAPAFQLSTLACSSGPFRRAPTFGSLQAASFPSGSSICKRRRSARRNGEGNTERPRQAQRDGVKTFGGWGRTRPQRDGIKGRGATAERRKPPSSRQPSDCAIEPQTNRRQSNPRRSNRSDERGPNAPTPSFDRDQ